MSLLRPTLTTTLPRLIPPSAIRVIPPSSIRSQSRSASSQTADNSSTWQGRQPHEHVTNRDDKHNIQVDASHQGKADRASGAQGNSQAATEADHGKQNERAKKEFPEAPGPVIGMNDERGGRGHK